MKKSRGHFNVVLPGCATCGRMLTEAKNMAEDAIAGYIASLKKHNEPIPTDTGRFILGGISWPFTRA